MVAILAFSSAIVGNSYAEGTYDYADFDDTNFVNCIKSHLSSTIIPINTKEDLKNLNALNELSCANKGIVSIKGIELLTPNSIDLSNNPGISNYSYLSLIDRSSFNSLNLSNNNISSIDLSSFQVSELDLSGNNFSSSSNLKMMWNKLRSLNLSGVKFTSLVIPSGTKLYDGLIINNSSLASIDLSQLSDTLDINLSHNALSSIVLNKTSANIRLNLSYNNFTEIPDASEWPSLSSLDLSHNSLTSLKFNTEKGYQTLDLSYNQLSEFYLPIASNVDLTHNKNNLRIVLGKGSTIAKILNIDTDAYIDIMTKVSYDKNNGYRLIFNVCGEGRFCDIIPDMPTYHMEVSSANTLIIDKPSSYDSYVIARNSSTSQSYRFYLPLEAREDGDTPERDPNIPGVPDTGFFGTIINFVKESYFRAIIITLGTLVVIVLLAKKFISHKLRWPWNW